MEHDFYRPQVTYFGLLEDFIAGNGVQGMDYMMQIMPSLLDGPDDHRCLRINFNWISAIGNFGGFGIEVRYLLVALGNERLYLGNARHAIVASNCVCLLWIESGSPHCDIPTFLKPRVTIIIINYRVLRLRLSVVDYKAF